MNVQSNSISEAQPGGVFLLRGWLGVLGLAPLGVVAATSPLHFAQGTYANFLVDVLGAALVLAGVAWRSWAQLFVGGRKTKSLVVAGPYAMSRHPLYFGSLLIGLGSGVLLQSVGFTAGFVVLFPLIYLPVIAEEERALVANHGEDHGAFVSAVPNRILPRFGRSGTKQTYVEVHMRAQWNQAKRSLLTLLVIPVLELVQLLRADGTLPVWFGMP